MVQLFTFVSRSLALDGAFGYSSAYCNGMQHAKALLMGKAHTKQSLAKKPPTAQVRDPEHPLVGAAAAEQFL